MEKYRIGDIAYIVESNKYVSEGKIMYICRDIITFRFTDRKGGTKVKAHRLFPSEEAAFASIQKTNRVSEQHMRAIMA